MSVAEGVSIATYVLAVICLLELMYSFCLSFQIKKITEFSKERAAKSRKQSRKQSYKLEQMRCPLPQEPEGENDVLPAKDKLTVQESSSNEDVISVEPSQEFEIGSLFSSNGSSSSSGSASRSDLMYEPSTATSYSASQRSTRTVSELPPNLYDDVVRGMDREVIEGMNNEGILIQKDLRSQESWDMTCKETTVKKEYPDGETTGVTKMKESLL
jgi:hypothetical protein